MNEDRVMGTATNVGGKVQEEFGRLTGDAGTQAKGAMNEAAGAVQNLYGQAKDVATDAAQTVRDGAANAQDYLRDFIETRPYTTAVVALCLGFFIARAAHRD